MFEMKFNLKRFDQCDQKYYVWVSPSRQHDWLLSVTYRLCITDLVNKHLSKKMKKNSVKEICKILEINGWILFLTNNYYLKVTSFNPSIKPATVVKLDEICQIYFFLASSLWNQQNFGSSYFWRHLIAWSASTLRQSSCITQAQKIFVAESIHIAI